jgi:hypothetical protein
MAFAEIMLQFVIQFPSFRAVRDYRFNIIELINVLHDGHVIIDVISVGHHQNY